MATKQQTVITLALGAAIVLTVAFLINHPVGRYIAAMVGGSIQYGHL